jgi:hypothetical protein
MGFFRLTREFGELAGWRDVGTKTCVDYWGKLLTQFAIFDFGDESPLGINHENGMK